MARRDDEERTGTAVGPGMPRPRRNPTAQKNRGQNSLADDLEGGDLSRIPRAIQQATGMVPPQPAISGVVDPGRSQTFQYDPQSVNASGNLAGGALEAFNQSANPTQADQAARMGRQDARVEGEQIRMDAPAVAPQQPPVPQQAMSPPQSPTGVDVQQAANQALLGGDAQGFQSLSRGATGMAGAQGQALQNQQQMNALTEERRMQAGNPALARNLTPEQVQALRGGRSQIGERTASNQVDYSGTLNPYGQAVASGDFTRANDIAMGREGPGVGQPVDPQVLARAQAELAAAEANPQAATDRQAQMRAQQERRAEVAQGARERAESGRKAAGASPEMASLARSPRFSGRPAAGETEEQYLARVGDIRRSRMNPELRAETERREAMDLARSQMTGQREHELNLARAENPPRSPEPIRTTRKTADFQGDDVSQREEPWIFNPQTGQWTQPPANGGVGQPAQQPQQTATAIPPGAPTATGPDGSKIYFDRASGQWRDVRSGQPIQGQR